MRAVVITLVILFLFVRGAAQSPCELRLSAANAQLAAERARAESAARVRTREQQEAARSEAAFISQAQATLDAERHKATVVAGELVTAQERVAALERELASRDVVIVAQNVTIASLRQQATKAKHRTWWAVAAAAALGVFGVFK